METELRHILVQYRGGGYDGCFWEWNYFYIDSQGEFHDIQSSGHAGCLTNEDAEALLAENSDNTYIYDVTIASDIADFSSASAAPHVLDVLQWFNENPQDNIDFFAICTECGKKITENGTLEGWHGCGGLASTADDLLCEDCYGAGICSCCSEYVAQASLYDYEQDTDNCSEEVESEMELWSEDNGPVCQRCWENERDNLVADEQQDTVYAAFATGTPDMFSNKMRGFWNA